MLSFVGTALAAPLVWQALYADIEVMNWCAGYSWYQHYPEEVVTIIDLMLKERVYNSMWWLPRVCGSDLCQGCASEPYWCSWSEWFVIPFAEDAWDMECVPVTHQFVCVDFCLS